MGDWELGFFALFVLFTLMAWLSIENWGCYNLYDLHVDSGIYLNESVVTLSSYFAIEVYVW